MIILSGLIKPTIDTTVMVKPAVGSNQSFPIAMAQPDAGEGCRFLFRPSRSRLTTDMPWQQPKARLGHLGSNNVDPETLVDGT